MGRDTDKREGNLFLVPIVGNLMNVTSITNIPDANQFWYVGFSDIISWIVGLIAIGIAIGIYIKQSKTSKKLEYIEKSNISASFRIILDNLTQSREQAWRLHQIIVNHMRNLGRNDEEYLAGMLRGYQPIFSNPSIYIIKEAEFLRPHIHADLYSNIVEVAQRIRVFSNPNELVTFGIPDTVDTWLNYTNDLIQRIDNLLTQIREITTKNDQNSD